MRGEPFGLSRGKDAHLRAEREWTRHRKNPIGDGARRRLSEGCTAAKRPIQRYPGQLRVTR